jgi:ATP-dependent helicase/DNAse subunit B
MVLSSPYFKLFTQTTKEWVGYYSKKGMLIKNANEWKILKNKIEATLRDNEELPPIEEKILDQIQREINILIGAADKFKKERNSLTGYAKDLRKFLYDLQWCETSSPLSHNEPINIEIQTIKYEFYNVLDTLENFETDFGEIVRSQTDFLRILKYLLERCEIEPEVKVRGVTILGFLETRGVDCDNLFFGGLSEDKFPGPTRFDPILPEWLKEKLKLPSIERHLARAKFHYFRLINTARTNTFLSFFNTDEDRLLLPSPFLTGECKSPADPNIIFTEEQKQRYNGSIEKIDLPSSISVVNFNQDQEAKDILSKKFGPTRNLYVTRLEQYPRCPYIFYLENVLELSPLEEPVYEVEAALWGTITHKVLEKLYENEFVPTEQIAPRLEKIINAVLIQENLPPFWNEVTKKILVNNIPAFVENEKTLHEQGFRPTHIEKRLMHSISKGIKVIGRIDRVDLNSLTNQVRILDYKTGSTTSISKSHIEKGSHLQLPLYAFLVKQYNPKWKIVDVGVYSISDNTIKWLVTDKNDLTEFINQAIKNARQIVYNIRQGRFDLSPSVCNCFYCDYSSICPIILSNKINQEENDSSASTPLFAQ